MTAYYNENDPRAAAWLRELARRGHIAPGDVDERSIQDVRPNDLAGYRQCHFFAGIGVWSYALRRAGWPDDRAVWTGSCPCQPFSNAGKGGGFDDERHLWPAWFQLVAQRRPSVVFGEQVASKDGLAWLDLVRADLEATDYAVGAVDLCAAGVGAPHIRQRLWFVADDDTDGCRGGGSTRVHERRQTASGDESTPRDADRTLGNDAYGRGPSRDLADAQREGLRARAEEDLRGTIGDAQGRFPGQSGVVGYWTAADWIDCRDGKRRPVEPGTFPLAHGTPARVGRLRGYGNAIVAPLAQAFIEAYLNTK